ncbi:glycosyltransferase [Pseudorhodobacter sp. W20_MBD10_FR17]|uniref:glycosyltransferase n=1 Tax=Pseudorhodobacter sp. W20_MBD10_FR17 TaxID=3240266 RepID=UPI003F9C3BA2
MTGQNLGVGQNPNERRAIVCAVTADHAFALAALIAGFRRHNPDYTGAFVVLHDGLTMKDQGQLRVLWPNIQFRPFGRDVLAQRFGANVDLSTILQQVSPMIFAKFELPELLADCDKCLWLDVDMLVQGNLAEVWNFDVLAWRPLPQGAFARRAEVMESFADMRGDGRLPLLNGGVLGMGRGVKISTVDLYAMAARLIMQTSTTSVDELAVYFLAASRGVPVHLLDQRFNHPVVAAGARAALVVHAIGPDKFWNAAPLQLAYPEWAQNLQQWQGAGYAGPQRLADVQAATPDMALKAARNRAYWQQLYTDIRPDLPLCLQVDLQSDGKTLRFSHASTAQLHLTRQTNARRIGVELHFAEGESLGAALAARLEGAVIPDLLNDETLKLAQTKHGWSYTAVVPVGQCAQVMGALAQALDHATSRAKS